MHRFFVLCSTNNRTFFFPVQQTTQRFISVQQRTQRIFFCSTNNTTFFFSVQQTTQRFYFSVFNKQHKHTHTGIFYYVHLIVSFLHTKRMVLSGFVRRRNNHFLRFFLLIHTQTHSNTHTHRYIVLLDKLIFRLTAWPVNLIFPVISVFWLLCVALILNVVLSHLQEMTRIRKGVNSCNACCSVVASSSSVEDYSAILKRV